MKYAKAYTEVLEIISHFSEEEYNKIPEDKINYYKEHSDKNYEYRIDPRINLDEQYISKEAETILISIYREYFLDDKQKKTLDEMLELNQKMIEKEKEEKYSTNDIFNNSIADSKEKNDNNITTDENKLIKQEKKSFIDKFFDFIKKLLKIE